MGTRILEGKSKIIRKTKLSSKIKIGLVGCGRASELIYLPALDKFSNVEVVGVVDPIKERRELLSAKFNDCRLYNSVETNFVERIDAAIISTPPDTHVALASLLLENNKYVLVEKPLALSMDEINDLIEIESLSTASLMMGFNHRHWQPLIELKEMLSRNSKVSSAEIIFTGNYSNWNPISFISDPLNDLGPHLFDLVRFIFSKDINSISATAINENSIKMKIRIAGNTFIDCHLAHSDKTIKSINVNSEEVNYCVFLGSTRILPIPGTKRKFLDLSDRVKRKLLLKTSPIKMSYEMQLNNFFNFIGSSKHAEPGIEDGISAIQAVLTARESININGKEIYLNGIK